MTIFWLSKYEGAADSDFIWGRLRTGCRIGSVVETNRKGFFFFSFIGSIGLHLLDREDIRTGGRFHFMSVSQTEKGIDDGSKGKSPEFSYSGRPQQHFDTLEYPSEGRYFVMPLDRYRYG